MEYVNTFSKEQLSLLNQREYKIKIKFEIMDWFENTIDEITYDISSGNIGNISVNYNQGVRRSCSFTIYDNTGKYRLSEDSPFQTYKKFKIYIGVYNNNDIYWWEQGVFISKNVSYDENILEVEAVDKFAVFTDELDFCCLQQTYIIPANTKVSTIVKDILLLDSMRGNVYDTIEPIIDINIANSYLPYEIKKEVGGYLGDILIEIATSCNADIYYDKSGHLVISKNKDGYYIHMQPLFHSVSDDLIDFNLSNDLASAKNIFTVYGYDTLGGLHQYTATNTNAMSPCRVDLVGNKPAEPEENEMCVTDEICKDYANYKMKQNFITSLSSSLSTHINPIFDVDNIIAISDEYFNFDYVPFVIKSLSIPLGVGLTSVQATNIQWLPAYTNDIYYTNILKDFPTLQITLNIAENMFELPAITQEDKISYRIDWGDGINERLKLNQINSHNYAELKEYTLNIVNIKQVNDSIFKDFTNISEIKYLSNGRKYVSYEIEPFTYYNCTSLINLTFEKALQYSICSYSFYNCTNLSSITFGEGLFYIGVSAFEKCSLLTEITLPNTLKLIGAKSFYNTNITKVKFQGSEDEWNNIEKGSDWINNEFSVEFVK